MNYYRLTTVEIFKLLDTGKKGLYEAIAEERLLQYGKNELIQKKKVSPVVLFFNQFKDVMIFILLIAAIIAIAVGDVNDAIVILIIVLLVRPTGIFGEPEKEKA